MKTPNAQRRTPNLEWGNGSVSENPNATYGGRAKYDLEDRLLNFTASVVKLADSLPNTKAGNHIAGQLLRCGTSPLANHGEVEAAESRKDSSQVTNLPKRTTRNLAMAPTDRASRTKPGQSAPRSPSRGRRADPNFCRERPDYREECQMTIGSSDFDIGRWALGVRRFPV
jgi:hypothetical protein